MTIGDGATSDPAAPSEPDQSSSAGEPPLTPAATEAFVPGQASAPGLPWIAVLGICDRAFPVGYGAPFATAWNILGLRSVVQTHIFPLDLAGHWVAIALHSDHVAELGRIQFRDSDAKVIGHIEIGARECTELPPAEAAPKGVFQAQYVVGSWLLWLIRIEPRTFMLNRPGVYDFVMESAVGSQVVGRALFELIEAPPLTTERVAAIRSDPRSAKAVQFTLGCRTCDSTLRLHASLDRAALPTPAGAIWYQDANPTFQCTCGATMVDLSSLRRNLHGLLGRRSYAGDAVSLTTGYEAGGVEGLRRAFARRLATAKREEDLQQFFDEHPMLLHQFPAELRLVKPRILTRFVADLGIVTTQRELILIELEAASLRLTRKDGTATAPLTHAIHQVLDWLQVADDHRAALLDTLKIPLEAVSTVSGVVIAGRDGSASAKHLRKLKTNYMDRVRLLTYDDILGAVGRLAGQIEGLA